MNILYISHLSGSKFGGPNYSVPAQVTAQATIDNVFWWNLSTPVLDSWRKTGYFHNTEDYGTKAISSLPCPFNRPELVVFEDFYYIDDCRLANECKRLKIPYIIVPRGALTKKAQATKWIKKKVANFIFFQRFTRNALAIQYLTDAERMNSGDWWNKRTIIIPNGVTCREYKCSEDTTKLTGVFIGRFKPAKGIDLLIDAIKLCRNTLIESNIKIELYGPKEYELWDTISDRITTSELTEVVKIHDAVADEEKAIVLNNADFFVITSRFEGMPMGLLEALSYSLPCIATDGTNMRKEIEESGAGFTCSTDAKSISEALTLLARERNHINKYREAAYKLSLNYDWVQLALRAHAEYQELLGRL